MSANIIEPTVLDRGSFVGDIFFGDPENSTRGTHRWDGQEWKMLPTDAETLLVLLARAREQRDSLKAALHKIECEANYRPELVDSKAAKFYAETCDLVAKIAREATANADPATPTSRLGAGRGENG